MCSPKDENAEFEVAEVANHPGQLDGFPTFATFIARDKDVAIYKAFKGLSARSLLYQQSELHDLERRLRQLDSEDAEDIENRDAQKAAVYWEHFSNDSSDEAKERRKVHAMIKVKLKEYRA